MIYEVSPENFGFTPGRQLLRAVGTLLAFALVVLVPSWISDSNPWSGRDVLNVFVSWLVFEIGWYWHYHYSIEVEQTSIRCGRRLVREGHIRYLRDVDGPLRGRQLFVSEHGSAWARLFRGGIAIPTGLAEYEQIKAKLSTWVVVKTTLP